MKVAYIVSRFPKITETFVLYEMETLRRAGIGVELFPLLRQAESTIHAEARQWMDLAHYTPFLSWRILKANWSFLRRGPGAYFTLICELFAGTWRSLNFFAGTLGIFLKTVRIAQQMEELGIDHIHAHFANHPSMAAFIVNRLTGIPYSFTAHGSDLHVIRRMLRKKVDAADFVVTISEYNKRLIVAECGVQVREKVKVIHCGVDVEVFGDGRASQEKDCRAQIICVASFDPVKGHRYLIEACAILKRRNIDFVCHLVGDGRLRAAIERQISELGLQTHVILHGARPRSAVASLLTQSDVAVLASAQTRRGDQEGIPVALMEAMAAGLPVVSTEISGIPELVENYRSGFLVPPADRQSLARALEALIRNSELRRSMGSEGREKILRHFNLRTNAAQLLHEMQSRRYGKAAA